MARGGACERALARGEHVVSPLAHVVLRSACSRAVPCSGVGLGVGVGLG